MSFDIIREHMVGIIAQVRINCVHAASRQLLTVQKLPALTFFSPIT
jgi:hypothetical protein